MGNTDKIESKIILKGFRLLGLLTGKRPSNEELRLGKRDFFKVLIDDTYYAFYASFSLDKKTNTLNYDKHNEIDIYNIEKNDGTVNPIINISAIVGKNGSGKSTLLELLYLASYHIGVAAEVLDDPNGDGKIFGIKEELGCDFRLFFQRENLIYQIIMFKGFNRLPNVFVYELKDNRVDLSLNHAEIDPAPEVKKTFLKELFYSIAVNYSLYGLNARQVGNWINALFHKNDGYQTPLVINPMRRDGDFDINLEENLAMSRLLTNLVGEFSEEKKDKKQSKYDLSQKQFVSKVEFHLEEDKLEYIHFHGDTPQSFEEFYKNNNGQEYFIEKVYSGLIKADRLKFLFLEEVENYLVKKLLKICLVYPEQYGHFIIKVLREETLSEEKIKLSLVSYKFHPERLNDFFDTVLRDNSHLTLKIRQTINFLKHPTLVESKNVQWEKKEYRYFDDGEELVFVDHFISLELSDFVKRISLAKTELKPLIDFLPPALFKPVLKLGPSEIGLEINFSALSSGEQQQIFSIQSLLYHLRNLESVFEQKTGEGIEGYRVPYDSVNIILDEIELYAHPEMQRKFISEFLTGIRRLNLRNIKGINILMTSHSPFILSDIPAQNILRLDLNKEGKSEPQPMKDQTFGANIHDLLANDFFLTDGFMGEFAREKIQNTINWLNSENRDMNKSISHLQTIELIGEPVLKRKLLEMYDSITGQSNELLYLKRRIEELSKNVKE